MPVKKYWYIMSTGVNWTCNIRNELRIYSSYEISATKFVYITHVHMFRIGLYVVTSYIVTIDTEDTEATIIDLDGTAVIYSDWL